MRPQIITDLVPRHRRAALHGGVVVRAEMNQVPRPRTATGKRLRRIPAVSSPCTCRHREEVNFLWRLLSWRDPEIPQPPSVRGFNGGRCGKGPVRQTDKEPAQGVRGIWEKPRDRMAVWEGKDVWAGRIVAGMTEAAQEVRGLGFR